MYLLLFIMVTMAILKYEVVWQVEQKVAFLEVVDDLFNTSLEIRRFEKNYFLYNKADDYQETLEYTSQLEDLRRKHETELSQLLSPTDLEKLEVLIAAYNEELRGLYILNRNKNENEKYGELKTARENDIRNIGKQIVGLTEQMSKLERRKIKNLLKTTRTILVLSIIFTLCAGFILAAVLGKSIVRNLKILEDHTRKISRGDFVEAPKVSTDREITSLLQALNRMTNELRIRQRQLVQSEKLASLGTLLSGVAHELNNPLSNISTSAQILAEEMGSDDLEFKQKLIAQVNDQADRSRDIVKTLLEFSRIKEFKKEKLNLRKLLRDTILLVKGQVPGDVEIRVDVPENMVIAADKQRMQQVFINLIKNALDVLDEHGHVWISAEPVVSGSGDKKEVEIMVGDDGPGVPPEILDSIFDPFFTTKDVGKGSGLGLFLVHDIIEWHGGSINVESRQGEGTTFIFWLPRNKDNGK